MPKPKLITYEGKTLTPNEWATLRGIKVDTIRRRLAQNMPTHDVLSRISFKNNRRISATRTFHTRAKMRADKRPWTLDAPRPNTGHQRFLTIDGATRSYAEWSVISGICVGTITGRVLKGATPEEAIAPLKRQTVTINRGSQPETVVTRRTMLTFMDETMTVEAWALDLCIPVARIIKRRKAGEPVEACLSKDLPIYAPGTQRRQARPGAPRMSVPTLAELDTMREAA